MKYQSQFEKGKATKFEILEVGLKLYPYVTPVKVAKVLGITHAAVIYHFPDLRQAVKEYAVFVKDQKVLKYLELENDPLFARFCKNLH